MQINEDPAKDKVAKMAKELLTGVAALVQLTIRVSGTNNLTSRVYLAQSAAVAALQTSAYLFGADPATGKTENSPTHKKVTGDNILLAALFAFRMGGDGVRVDGTSLNTFGPEVFCEALDDFETLTGRSPDAGIDREFVEGARRFVAEAGKPLEELMKSK